MLNEISISVIQEKIQHWVCKSKDATSIMMYNNIFYTTLSKSWTKKKEDPDIAVADVNVQENHNGKEWFSGLLSPNIPSSIFAES